MRVLWADDQIQVAKTLAGVLAPLNAQVDFVADGSGALARLEKYDYDLILLDLRMPPGEWGGLHVLEAMRESRIPTPAVVISGEGDQAETIHAQRLGAKDYVTKESVEDELLARADVVLKAARAERNRFLLEETSPPIAVPLGRIESAGDDEVLGLRRSIEFVESLIRLCVVVGLAELRDAGSNGVFRDLLGEEALQLRRPSLGTLELARRRLRDRAHRFFPQLDGTVSARTSERVTAIRNDLAHSAEPSSVRARALLAELDGPLNTIRNRIWRHVTASLVTVRSLEYDDAGCFSVRGVSIQGRANTLTATNWVCDRPLPSGHVLMADGQEYLDLHPLLLTRPGDDPATWQMLTFDGFDNRPDRMRYVDTWSGARTTETAETLGGMFWAYASR